MERLTHERVNGIKSGYWSAATKETLVQRLAAYEETGLTPDEVKAIHKFFNDRTMAEFEKLHDLLAAEAEGRLVVLPCKVGDKVWAVGERRIIECEIDEAYLDDVKGLEFLVSYRCGYPEDGDECCKDCPFYGWHQQYCGEWACEGEWGNASVLFADIGKTVFLTLEEAEAALKGESNG